MPSVNRLARSREMIPIDERILSDKAFDSLCSLRKRSRPRIRTVCGAKGTGTFFPDARGARATGKARAVAPMNVVKSYSICRSQRALNVETWLLAGRYFLSQDILIRY